MVADIMTKASTASKHIHCCSLLEIKDQSSGLILKKVNVGIAST